MQQTKYLLAAGAALIATLMPTSALAAAPAKAKSYLVYTGSYTNTGKSKGIYAYRFNPVSGELTSVGLEAETTSPSFVATDPQNRFLYAVGEINQFNGQKGGSASAWAMDSATGKLTFLNSVSTRGAGPCHLVVDKTGKTLVVANYNSGSVASFPIGADGRLGEAVTVDQHTGSSADPARQKGPHSHSVYVSADNRFVVSADLGLDKLFVYHIDPATSTLTPNDPPFASVAPGSGPRHFAFSPNQKHGYAINEMKSTVTAFDYDAKKGAFKEIQTISTLPPDYKGDTTTAEIFVHPNGKFLYGSNRGHDSIAVFSIDGAGKLTLMENAPTQGKTPRGFGIDPSGHFVVVGNQDTDNLVVLKIDQKTGKLTPTGQNLSAGKPVCVIFVPSK